MPSFLLFQTEMLKPDEWQLFKKNFYVRKGSNHLIQNKKLSHCLVWQVLGGRGRRWSLNKDELYAIGIRNSYSFISKWEKKEINFILELNWGVRKKSKWVINIELLITFEFFIRKRNFSAYSTIKQKNIAAAATNEVCFIDGNGEFMWCELFPSFFI